MVTELHEIERRVLGVLMEKEMAHPDYYPMTLNALVAGSNQKQNRHPVMELDAVAVEGALKSLQQHGLVTLLLPTQGARSNRYRHEAAAHFGWDKPQRAVMTELLLRGPQTTGELKSRCARFVRFADLAAVSEVLDALGRLDPPQVAALPREPGRSAVRCDHRFYPADERPTAEPPIAAGASVGAVAAPPLTDLQQEVRALRAEVDALRNRLIALEATRPRD